MGLFKKLNNNELNKATGGESTLEKYLKRIVKGPKEILVDKGTGKKLELNNKVDCEDNNNVYVIKREKDPFDE